MKNNRLVFLAGHTGMVGSSLSRELSKIPNVTLLLGSHTSLDLTNQAKVESFLRETPISSIYMMAGLVGGIKANNNYPGDFLYQNMMMNANVIHAAYQAGIESLLVLGSACMYPVNSNQPMQESSLMAGLVESTNEAYAIAKIATVKMAEMYRRQYNFDVRILIPTNMYGPGDHYDPDSSHVIPALLKKFHEARLSGQPIVEIWGSGKPLRDFLYVADFAKLCVKIMDLEKSEYQELVGNEPYINVCGSGEVSIDQLSHLVANVVGYTGEISFDRSKPDGAPRKVLDAQKLSKIDWKAETKLTQGLKSSYKDFLKIYREN
jgi:GDP-L-fucose synthase